MIKVCHCIALQQHFQSLLEYQQSFKMIPPFTVGVFPFLQCLHKTCILVTSCGSRSNTSYMFVIFKTVCKTETQNTPRHWRKNVFKNSSTLSNAQTCTWRRWNRGLFLQWIFWLVTRTGVTDNINDGFVLCVRVSLDSVTMSQCAEYQEPETQAARIQKSIKIIGDLCFSYCDMLARPLWKKPINSWYSSFQKKPQGQALTTSFIWSMTQNQTWMIQKIKWYNPNRLHLAISQITSSDRWACISKLWISDVQYRKLFSFWCIERPSMWHSFSAHSMYSIFVFSHWGCRLESLLRDK